MAGYSNTAVEARGGARAADAPSEDAEPPAAITLTVNLRERRVTYRGIDIPTHPPHSLQRQPLLALAVLAAHPGQTIALADLATEMIRVGGTTRRLLTPEARDLRYKLLAPFRHALRTKVPKAEIEHLVETVSTNGLRLNPPGAVSVVGPDA